MRKTIKTLLVAATAAPMTAALLGGPAQAGDAKTYPGSMCVRYSGASPSYSSSAIGNPSSTQWLYLDCPAINDSMNEDLNNSWVGALDRHYSSDIRCSVNSAYWNSTHSTFYGWWGSNQYSSGSGNHRQLLSWGGLSGSGETVHTYFSCRIPPTYSGNRSYIISYHTNED